MEVFINGFLNAMGACAGITTFILLSIVFCAIINFLTKNL